MGPTPLVCVLNHILSFESRYMYGMKRWWVMASKYDHAELLAALWILGSDAERLLPTSHGILDRALEACRADLPQTLKDDLSFDVTSVGLRCHELPAILLAAQEAMLTSEPNPTYLSTIVTLEPSAAREIVVAHGLSSIAAQTIGRQLHAAVAKAKEARAPNNADHFAAA